MLDKHKEKRPGERQRARPFCAHMSSYSESKTDRPNFQAEPEGGFLRAS